MLITTLLLETWANEELEDNNLANNIEVEDVLEDEGEPLICIPEKTINSPTTTQHFTMTPNFQDQVHDSWKGVQLVN